MGKECFPLIPAFPLIFDELKGFVGMRRWNFKKRLGASGIHLGISLAIAGLVAALVFGLWYPYPYREISGGRELFMLVVVVDVVMGPLITLAIFNLNKPRRELLFDLTAVGLLQLAALGYGLWTVFAARPVHLVFEYHRMAVVHAADVDATSLKQAPLALRVLPLTGPTWLSLRPFKDGNEEFESTMKAVGGVAQAAQPTLWQPWGLARADILKESRSVTELKERFPAQAALIDSAVAATGRQANALRYVPLVARDTSWTVLVEWETAEPLGFLPLDSF